MNICKINLSKDKLHSEDSVFYDVINDRFTIIVNSDGNGSMGIESEKIVYDFGDGCLELGSMISITTDHYTKRIFESVISQIKAVGFNLKLTISTIKNIINDEIKIDLRPVCFCFLLSIFDFVDRRLYTFGLGDCGYSIIDLNTKIRTSTSLQKTKCLAFNGRGNALVSCPNSIHNCREFIQEPIDIKIIDIPSDFVFLQYSDGLDYDIAIPIQMIEDKLKGDRPIIWNYDTFIDSHIIKIHNKLNNRILKDDKPNVSYSRYNLTRDELLSIILDNNSSQKILSRIIKHTSELESNRKKIDDISLCVLYFKLT